MSIKSQQNNMKAIYNLIQKELGYCYGDKESVPNGAKKVFLSKSAAFLRALAKDLRFREYKININPGGIAVSGEVSLYGMWGDSNGIYLQISNPCYSLQGFLYRKIKHINDYTGECNIWLSEELFMNGDYEVVLNILSSINATKNHAEVGLYVA